MGTGYSNPCLKCSCFMKFKATGRGPRSKNMVFDMFCISRSRAGCKNRIKNIIPSGSNELLARNTNFKSRYLKTTLGTFFEKTLVVTFI